MKRILIVTDSYPPEVRSAAQLMKDLAEGLTEHGHRVWVVTSSPRYNVASGTEGTLPCIAEEKGVHIVRLKTLPHHRVNFIIRGVAQLILPHLFRYGVAKYIREPIDVVITHTPPLPLYTVGRKLKRVYGTLNILNVHDIFPQNAVDLGVMRNQLLVKWFERMERRAYRDADVLVVPSEQHKRFLEEKRNVPGEKIRVAEHWLDLTPFTAAKRTGAYREKYGLEDKLIFLFAGVLGPSQGLDMLMEAARELKRHPETHFLFVGEGTAKERLREVAETHNLDNISFEPFVPSEEYPELVKDCDVCLVTLTSKNTTPAVPAKLTGYMAAGRPVAAFVHRESAARDMVREADCGVTAPSDDKGAVIHALKTLYERRAEWDRYGRNAETYARKHFAKEIAVGKFEAIIGNGT